MLFIYVVIFIVIVIIKDSIDVMLGNTQIHTRTQFPVLYSQKSGSAHFVLFNPFSCLDASDKAGFQYLSKLHFTRLIVLFHLVT